MASVRFSTRGWTLIAPRGSAQMRNGAFPTPRNRRCIWQETRSSLLDPEYAPHRKTVGVG